MNSSLKLFMSILSGILFLSCNESPMKTQNNIIIRGKVVDSITQKPLEEVRVLPMYKNEHTDIIQISDDNGFFKLIFEKDSIDSVEFSIDNYHTKRISIPFEKSNMDNLWVIELVKNE